MSIRIISWNLYYGTTNNTTPVGRFNQVAQIAANNNVDLVFLQEHPGHTSQYTNHQGFLKGANVPNGYTYYVDREMNANVTNRVGASNRSYAVLVKNTCTVNGRGYFNQNQFRSSSSGPALRCPVLYQITHNNTNYNFFHWHNEVGNFANAGMQIFINQNLPNNTVLVGDLNVYGRDVNQANFFNNWYDVVVGGPNSVNGVDHILTPLYCNPVLGNQLNFVSDSNHYPIAADVG